MAEYIERESAMLLPELPKEYRNYQTDNLDDAYEQGWYDALFCLEHIPAADVAPVVHGRWIEHEETQEDAYSHHKCSECNVNAPFYYKMREDWDEGMDGEWYSIGLVDDGINEYLTDYCPNCGARMDALSE